MGDLQILAKRIIARRAEYGPPNVAQISADVWNRADMKRAEEFLKYRPRAGQWRRVRELFHLIRTVNGDTCKTECGATFQVERLHPEEGSPFDLSQCEKCRARQVRMEDDS